MTSPPEGYDRSRYLGYLEELKEGRLGPPKSYREGHGYYAPHFNTIMRAFSFTPIPNRKYDVNINPRPIAFPFPEENAGYAEGSWEERERICRRHRELTLGLLYFAQNDDEVPEEQRELARKYHLPKDEFVDSGHFPWQLYVREARRLDGMYTITELDISTDGNGTRTKVHTDAVATGEFPIDSFPVTKEASKGGEVLEGYVGVFEGATNPYQIPLRALLPVSAEGIVVPVAASASHVAFSTLRMEPLWMALGQAAGIVADLSVSMGCEPRELPIALLQQRLLEGGAVISYFEDLDPSHAAYAAIQFWAARGFFSTYRIGADEPVTPGLLARWITVAEKFLGAALRPIDLGKSLRIDLFDDRSSGTVSRDQLRDMLAVRFAHAGAAESWSTVGGNRPVTRGDACLALFEIALSLPKSSSGE